MEEDDKKRFVPILPFDGTYGEHFALYDNLPYKEDVTLCNKETIRMESGNVYKYYRCIASDTYHIGGN